MGWEPRGSFTISKLRCDLRIYTTYLYPTPPSEFLVAQTPRKLGIVFLIISTLSELRGIKVRMILILKWISYFIFADKILKYSDKTGNLYYNNPWRFQILDSVLCVVLPFQGWRLCRKVVGPKSRSTTRFFFP